jgi:hypothetical protein
LARLAVAAGASANPRALPSIGTLARPAASARLASRQGSCRSSGRRRWTVPWRASPRGPRRSRGLEVGGVGIIHFVPLAADRLGRGREAVELCRRESASDPTSRRAYGRGPSPPPLVASSDVSRAADRPMRVITRLPRTRFLHATGWRVRAKLTSAQCCSLSSRRWHLAHWGVLFRRRRAARIRPSAITRVIASM